MPTRLKGACARTLGIAIGSFAGMCIGLLTLGSITLGGGWNLRVRQVWRTPWSPCQADMPPPPGLVLGGGAGMLLGNDIGGIVADRQNSAT